MKFNDTNIFVGYIKQLLKEFNTPSINVFVEDIPVVKNQLYIYKNYIVMALITGIVSNISTELKIVDSYSFNDFKLNLTTNLQNESISYDTNTHTLLGNYLRYIRDYRGVNLMSMYNCFANETIDNMYIDYALTPQDTYEVFDASENSKVFIVPVKFFREYTIFISSSQKVEIIADFFSNKQLVSDTTFNLYEQHAFLKATHKHYGFCNYSNPIIYTPLKNIKITESFYAHEKDLKLFIKVPKNTKSSIIVLEGNFANMYHLDTDGYRRVSVEVHNYVKENDSKRKYNSLLQLSSIPPIDGIAFSNRLIEYLTNFAVSPLTTIDENIGKVQNKVLKVVNSNLGSSYLGPQDVIGTYGIWNDTLHNVIYDEIYNGRGKSIPSKRGFNKFDMIGYFDKDIENEFGGIE